MLIEALTPMDLILPNGMKTLNAGDRVDLPVDKAQKLLELAKGKVRLIEEESFYIGQTVRFRIPVNIIGPQSYAWEEHVGLVEIIDHEQHLVLVIPEIAQEPWWWVAMAYISPTEKNGNP